MKGLPKHLVKENYKRFELSFILYMYFVKTVKVAILASGDHLRNTPRTCRTEVANNDKLIPESGDNARLRENMKSLLEVILTHFELEDNEKQEP